MNDALLVALVPTLVSGLLVWLNNRPNVTNQLVDQLQEQVARHDKRLDDAENHIRMQDDYISRLRQHINDELGPPPPPWPTYQKKE